jgi:hypothetical protein
MTTDWDPIYQEAFHEFDLKVVSGACDRARKAINMRLTEIASENIAAEVERERLREALRQLVFHEYNLRPPN